MHVIIIRAINRDSEAAAKFMPAYAQLMYGNKMCRGSIPHQQQ
jgi:hypothetical protein